MADIILPEENPRERGKGTSWWSDIDRLWSTRANAEHLVLTPERHVMVGAPARTRNTGNPTTHGPHEGTPARTRNTGTQQHTDHTKGHPRERGRTAYFYL